MANKHQAARLRAALIEQQVQKATLAIGVQARGGLVSHDNLGRANQRTSCGDTLLLTDAEFARRYIGEALRIQLKRGKQLPGDLPGRLSPKPLLTMLGEAETQGDVLHRVKVGDQVKLLEYEAEVIGSETVAA